MRITTKMINNSMMAQMTQNKSNMYGLEEQYNSGKKIQRPSDDPIVAVRSLKLRSTISEVSQYLDKNIPDARSWMEVTESSLKNMNTIFTNIYNDMSKGANDTLTTSDRATIVENLKQYKEQIYKEGNTDNAGRYVFTGFKTNNSLTFDENEKNLDYTITQEYAGTDIERVSKVTGGYSISDYDSANPDATVFADAPKLLDDIYRIQLGYNNLVGGSVTAADITYSAKDAAGNVTEQTIDNLGYTVTEKSAYDSDAYDVGADEIRFLPETGDLLMGENVYESLRLQEDGQIKVTYEKNEFKSGEVKPEHYYDCTVTNQYGETTQYDYEKQDIYYEINFGQKIKVNTCISEVLGNDLGRTIDDIVNTVEKVNSLEKELTEINKLLSDSNITDAQKTALERLKGQKEVEYSMQNGLMTDAFEDGLAYTKKYQSEINIAVANLGSRMSRLNLVEDRLDTQKTDYTDLLSENEDVDMVETYINLSSAENIYNASLQVSTKIAKTSLLDYI